MVIARNVTAAAAQAIKAGTWSPGVQEVTLPPWSGDSRTLLSSTEWWEVKLAGPWVHYVDDEGALGPLEIAVTAPPRGTGPMSGVDSVSGVEVPQGAGAFTLRPGAMARLPGEGGKAWVRAALSGAYNAGGTTPAGVSLRNYNARTSNQVLIAPVNARRPTLLAGEDGWMVAQVGDGPASVILPGLDDEQSSASPGRGLTWAAVHYDADGEYLGAPPLGAVAPLSLLRQLPGILWHVDVWTDAGFSSTSAAGGKRLQALRVYTAGSSAQVVDYPMGCNRAAGWVSASLALDVDGGSLGGLSGVPRVHILESGRGASGNIWRARYELVRRPFPVAGGARVLAARGGIGANASNSDNLGQAVNSCLVMALPAAPDQAVAADFRGTQAGTTAQVMLSVTAPYKPLNVTTYETHTQYRWRSTGTFVTRNAATFAVGAFRMHDEGAGCRAFWYVTGASDTLSGARLDMSLIEGG